MATAKGPVIAVVGSFDEQRRYEPPLARAEVVNQACAELGRELALRGCRIVVYSNAAGFIERDVVRGYLASGQAEPSSILVRRPYEDDVDFAGFEEHREVFDIRPDSSPDWEVSFYRSLAQTDGVVLVGGGSSTYVAGLIAIAYSIPLLAVATFGGKARKAWEALSKDKGLTTDEEIAAMAQDWHAGSAGLLVGGLLTTGQRRRDAEGESERRSRSSRRHAVLSAVTAATLFVLAVAAIPLSWSWRPGTSGPAGILVLAPLMAGAAGSLVRVVFDAGRDWIKAAVLGLTAGGVTVLLFVAAQIAATPDILKGEGPVDCCSSRSPRASSPGSPSTSST